MLFCAQKFCQKHRPGIALLVTDSWVFLSRMVLLPSVLWGSWNHRIDFENLRNAPGQRLFCVVCISNVSAIPFVVRGNIDLFIRLSIRTHHQRVIARTAMTPTEMPILTPRGKSLSHISGKKTRDKNSAGEAHQR